MSRTRWIEYNELVVGQNHPTLSDIDNRPLKDVILFSNGDPDADDFPGFLVTYRNGATDPNGLQVGNVGNGYFSTNDSSFWVKSIGDGTNTGWVKISGSLASALAAIGDGTNVINTGFKGVIEIPFKCNVVAVRLFSSDAAITSGSIVVDIWKTAYASYPPTVGGTITAAAKPTIVAGTKYEDTTLTGWTTLIEAGSILGYKVDSVASFKQILVALTLRKV